MLEGIREVPPEELSIASIIDRTGWTYKEFLETPQWLVDTLRIKWSLDNEHQQKINNV